MTVSVHQNSSAGLTFGPVVALKIPTITPRHFGTTYDVSRDGRTIYFMQPGNAKPPREISLVLGWRALVQ